MSEHFEGAADMAEKIARICTQTQQRIGSALYREGLDVMKDSMRRTPVDTGALRASHELQPVQGRGDETSITIQAGGPSAPYGLIVHERLDVNHPVGEAKFLENAINAAKPGLLDRMAARLKLD